MAALQCDICGGSLTMDAGGEFATCEACGMKHDRLRLKQKISVDGLAGIDNLLVRAKQFYDEQNYEKAWEYCERVLDLDANNNAAHMIKKDTQVAAQDAARQREIDAARAQEEKGKEKSRTEILDRFAKGFCPPKSMLEKARSYGDEAMNIEIARGFDEYIEKLENGQASFPFHLENDMPNELKSMFEQKKKEIKALTQYSI